MLLIFKFMDRLDTRGLFMLDALSISLERILCTLDIPSIIFLNFRSYISQRIKAQMWKPQLIIIDRFRSEMNSAIC